MDELFSCRNCVHNPAQSPNIGPGHGYCLQHGCVVQEPDRTTCKYLRRKDLPSFVVEEGIREHAAEFAVFSGPATLDTGALVMRIGYSEKYCWEHGTFDTYVHSVAQYHKTEPSWTFIQALSPGVDGRASLQQASLVRRYMDNCGTWRSSYRLTLNLLQNLDSPPLFGPDSLVTASDQSTDGNGSATEAEDIRADASWDVVFTRLAGIQEYGFHAGIEEMMWATDHIGDALIDLDLDSLLPELTQKRETWTEMVIEHAKSENEFFPKPEVTDLPSASSN